MSGGWPWLRTKDATRQIDAMTVAFADIDAAIAADAAEMHDRIEYHESRSLDVDGHPIVKGLGDERAATFSARGDGVATVITPQQARVHAREGTGRNDSALLKPAAGSEPADSLSPVSLHDEKVRYGIQAVATEKWYAGRTGYGSRWSDKAAPARWFTSMTEAVLCGSRELHHISVIAWTVKPIPESAY